MNRLPHMLAALAVVVALFGAGVYNRTLRTERKDRGLTTVDPLENAPPMVAFTTVALGGFRGMIADWLWMRSSTLQDEGRYFELVQLADWITKLEPRLSSVWVFHSWNLAYNISVAFDNPVDRWRWVRHGISLLRDEGLKYNPRNAEILWQLGWLFQHKIGMNLDDAHPYYKQAWAEEMAELFDGAAPDFEAYAAALAAPASAPPAVLRRAQRLRDEYKLDPAVMGKVERTLGPFDWRLPQAHAVYWAYVSSTFATGFDAVRAERMITQSIADAFRQGRLFWSPQEEHFLLSPNLELIPRVQELFEKAIREKPDVGTFPSAYRFFLIEAIRALYTYNRAAEARKIFDLLAARYPGDDTRKGFDAFVVATIAKDMKDLSDRDAQVYVEGFLKQSLFWEGLGDERQAAGFDQLARLCWNEYMKDLTDPAFRQRVGIPPIATLRELALRKLKEEWPDRPAIQRLKLRAEAP